MLQSTFGGKQKSLEKQVPDLSSFDCSAQFPVGQLKTGLHTSFPSYFPPLIPKKKKHFLHFPRTSLRIISSLHNTVVTPCCGHGGHTAPCVRSGVVAKDVVKIVAAIASSNSVNKIVMNAHTVAVPFCGHGGHTAPYVRSGVIAKDAVKSVAAIDSSNNENEIAMNAHTVAVPSCGHGGHTAPCVRRGVIAKDAAKSVAAIVTSNSVNEISMKAHTIIDYLCPRPRLPGVV